MDSDIITIDMTPSWSALIEPMLEAHANMWRKRNAKGCGGQAEGWCWVHDMGFERETDTVCEFFHGLAGAEQSVRLNALSRDFHDLVTEFKRMAEAADRYNDLKK